MVGVDDCDSWDHDVDQKLYSDFQGHVLVLLLEQYYVVQHTNGALHDFVDGGDDDGDSDDGGGDGEDDESGDANGDVQSDNLCRYENHHVERDGANGCANGVSVSFQEHSNDFVNALHHDNVDKYFHA